MNLNRVTSTVGASAVAGIAAWSSWSHMVATALRYGERPEVAYVLPLSVDGLLVVASAALVDDKRAGKRPRMSARVAFALGVVASLAANMAHAQPNTGARIISAWPAIALLAVVELMSRSGRQVKSEAPVTAVPQPVDKPTSVAPNVATERKPLPPAAVKVAKVRKANPAMPQDAVAKHTGLALRTVQRHWPVTAPDEPERVNGVQVPQLALSN
ncbi:DUF2637 domain-containing protein [Micromonospora sp. SL1-18]|uniref:DUF2637 domain-containing protein n=1 Tax=Micromonospora sp. SL1-18 TaxID=3399128 RepID=UPI003A4D7EE9